MEVGFKVDKCKLAANFLQMQPYLGNLVYGSHLHPGGLTILTKLTKFKKTQKRKNAKKKKKISRCTDLPGKGTNYIRHD